MNNTAINSNSLTENIPGINMESIPEMAETIKSENDILNEISENSEPIDSEDNNSIMITQEMMDEELEKIKDCNFLELIQIKKELKNKKKYMENAKETVQELLKTKESLSDSLNQMDKTKSLGDKLAIADAESKIGMDNDDDIQSFLDNYDISIKRLDDTIEIVSSKISEYQDIPKTTTYMNKVMVEIIDKRIKSLDEKADTLSTPIYNSLKKYYLNIKDIYQERDNVDWIIEKIKSNNYMLKSFINRINKERKQNKNLSIVGAQKQATKAFCKMFSIEQMRAFDKYLKDLYNPENSDKDISVFMTQYILYVIYDQPKTKKFGNHKRIEMLIMNVIDIISNNYDLPNGIEYFNNQLLKIKDAVMEDIPQIKNL